MLIRIVRSSCRTMRSSIMMEVTAPAAATLSIWVPRSLMTCTFIPDVLNIGSDDSFPCILRNILPNLREINLSNTSFDYEVFLDFPQKCMHLNKITWNNIRYDSNVSITGEDMRYENNLTQICMDDSIFRAGFYCKWMSNLEDVKYSTIYPFHALTSSVLERVSIRNARWFPRKYPSKKIETFNIPQNSLI